MRSPRLFPALVGVKWATDSALFKKKENYACTSKHIKSFDQYNSLLPTLDEVKLSLCHTAWISSGSSFGFLEVPQKYYLGS